MFILFDRSEEDALNYRRRLYQRYVHSLTLLQAETERVADYPVHGILIPHPENLDDPIGLCTLLRERYPHLPIGIIYRESCPLHYYHLKAACDLLFEERTTVPKIISLIYKQYETKGNKSPVSRITSCVRTDSNRPKTVFVLAQAFPASHTQWMLIRYLNLASPRAVPAKELLDVGFLPGKARSPKNVGAQLTKFDRLIERGFPFRVFHCRYPSTYYIHQSNLTYRG